MWSLYEIRLLSVLDKQGIAVNDMLVNVIITDYEAVQVKELLSEKLSQDKRINEYKIYKKYIDAIDTISRTAYILNMDILDISPKK